MNHHRPSIRPAAGPFASSVDGTCDPPHADSATLTTATPIAAGYRCESNRGRDIFNAASDRSTFAWAGRRASRPDSFPVPRPENESALARIAQTRASLPIGLHARDAATRAG